MTRYWLNLTTLRYRFNDLEYGPARTDAERWLGDSDLGWFDTPERMNEYVRAQVLPVLEEAWKAHPEWRLGQLIANATNERDPYHLGDGDMRERLAKIADDT